MNPVTDTVAAAKSAISWKTIVAFIVGYILVNALLDVIGNFVPAVPAFVLRPVSTVKALVAAKTAPKS